MTEWQYTEGQKVTFRGDVYDFGYYSLEPGQCVIYEEGERDMQSSYAVSLWDVAPTK